MSCLSENCCDSLVCFICQQAELILDIMLHVYNYRVKPSGTLLIYAIQVQSDNDLLISQS